MVESLDGYDDPYKRETDWLLAYEWYAAGGTEELPSTESLTPEQQENVVEYARFLDWKYAEGLWEAERRKNPDDPEYIRSQFRLIQGGQDN